MHWGGRPAMSMAMAEASSTSCIINPEAASAASWRLQSGGGGRGSFACWPRARRAAAVLAVLVPSLLALIFIWLYAAGSGDSHRCHAPDGSSCTSVACIQQAAFTAGALSASGDADPCRDFYEFACGGYSGSVFGGGGFRVQDRLQLKARTRLARELARSAAAAAATAAGATQHGPPAWQRRLGQFYQACLAHYGSMSHSSGAELMKLLRRLTGATVADDQTGGVGNFLLGQGVSRVDSGKMFVAVCGKLYVPSFITVASELSDTDGKYGIQVDSFVPNGLAEFFVSLNPTPAELSKYRQFIEEAAALFVRQNGLNDFSVRNSTIREFAEDVIEIDLIRWQSYMKDLHDVASYNRRISIDEITKKMPMIDLPACLKEIYGSEVIAGNTTIVIGHMSYLETFSKALEVQKNSTDNYDRKMGNYLTWLTISYFDEFVSPEFEFLVANLRHSLLQPVSPTEVQADPQYRCLDYAAANMHDAVSALYVDKFYSLESKKLVDSMFSQLRSAVMRGVKRLDWMDQVTRVSTEKVLNGLVGSSDQLVEAKANDNLNNAYANLTFSGSFLAEIGQLRQVHRRQQLARLQSTAPVASGHWERPWLGYIRRSSGDDHRVLVPAGAQQQPLFSAKLPGHIVYGGFGVSLAAGIVSTFAATFQERLGAAPLRKANWMLNASVASSYKATRLCSEENILQFADAYNRSGAGGTLGQSYNITSTLIDLVLTEAAALKYSWQAFKDSQPSTMSSASSSHLPTFSSYTMKQSFYLAYAQSQCSMSPNYFETTAWRSAFFPNRVFVNSVLVSDKRFARAFNCKRPDLMHPRTTKCKAPVY